ncbi:MAG: hypothetical protein HFH87_02405 [Lachnospiraceae bacterium]|nr:hypothetical protein [Lachnospiraceae bacterium]
MMTKKKYHWIWFCAGIVAVTCSMIPNFILGEDSIFTAHDQLDGEMIAYILQARNLFGGAWLPEFMGGMWKTALTMPAPACVLLFLGGNYFAALTAMQFAGRLAGFVGMYLLARKMTGTRWIAAAAGLLYAFLPFLPVYGLSQYGIPLLFWCVLEIREKKHLFFCYGYIVVFALNSSLVLVGFGLLGMGGLQLLWELRGRTGTEKGKWLRLLWAWVLLLGVYIAENVRLLAQLLGLGNGSISHKTEYVLGVKSFGEAFLRNLLKGGQHSEGYQGLLITVVLTAVSFCTLSFLLIGKGGLLPGETEHRARLAGNLKCMGACLGWNVLWAMLAAFWTSSVGVAVRSSMGTLGAFQLDRVLWISPCLWYLAAASGAEILLVFWKGSRGSRIRYFPGICMIIVSLVAGMTGVGILLAGDVKSNFQKLRNPDYPLLSYRDYYAIGVMEQVRDFLEEETGKSQEEYRVVSLGIDPAAALYHGFYCLDGYSNNYSLEYKHRFRRIIAPELDKNDYIRAYFDEWGNRCYLFSAECPGYYTIEKNGFYFQQYQPDTEALRKMGCDYLLSAACIQNASEEGLRLMNEIPFETENSYYHIYVYEICG